MDYKTVVCGGTFDHLHKGHEAFLRFVFATGEHVVIGLTSDAFLAAHKPHPSLQSYKKRYEQLTQFLENENLLQKAEIFSIDDIYGPSIDVKIPLDAIAVTDETASGAEMINQKRKELGLAVLPVAIMPRLTAISSSLIREGKIDTSGSLFIEEKWATKEHTLPHELRKALQQPFGQLLLTDKIPDMLDKQIITVGDATTARFHSDGKRQKISVIDFVVERKPTYASFAALGFHDGYEVYEVANPPATLTPQLWQAIRTSFTTVTQEEIVIRVTGEEDLAVIPLVLVAPLGYHIFYGQPHEGLVWVQVTLDAKKKAYGLLKRFL